MDLHAELTGLLRSLETRGASYALAGGLALAVHGVVRATEGIDLLVPDEELERVAAVARELGRRLRAAGRPPGVGSNPRAE